MRLNRWSMGALGVFFVGSRVRDHDYWGAAFGTLIFVWVALRYPYSDWVWADTGRRVAEVAFVTTSLAAIWFTMRS